MPRSTPASTGFFRAHASSAVAAQAVARVSKLVNACTSTSGDAAISAASHGRRRAVLVTAQIVTSQASASQNAEMSKNTVTARPVGSQPASAIFSQPSVSFAFTHWKRPVSTGYSIQRWCCVGLPSSSNQLVWYGKPPLSSCSAEYSGMMSE